MLWWFYNRQKLEAKLKEVAREKEKIRQISWEKLKAKKWLQNICLKQEAV